MNEIEIKTLDRIIELLSEDFRVIKGNLKLSFPDDLTTTGTIEGNKKGTMCLLLGSGADIEDCKQNLRRELIIKF